MSRIVHRDLPTAAGAAEPELTCLLLHHAGGSSASFVDIARDCPRPWLMRAIEMPGRGAAARRTPFDSTADAVAALAPVVEQEITGPYAIFGHSMGALIGYELARELERRGRPPVWLGVSAMPAPNLVSGNFPDRRDLWPHERLAGFIRDMGGTPEEFLEDESVLAYMVRLLRLDLRLVDTYEYLTGPALATSLSIFYGEQDPLTRPVDVEAWRSYCTGRIEVHPLAGGHFSFFEQPRTVGDHLVADLDRALARPASPTGGSRRSE